MRFLTTVCALLLFAAPAGAQKIAVFPPSAVNLTPDEARAIGVTFAMALRKQTNQEVLGPDETGPILEQTEGGGQTERARAAATKLGANRFLVVDAVKLGTRITFQAWLHGEGAPRNAEMAAAGLEDVPTVSGRIVEALLKDRAPEEVRTHKTVTTAEAKPRNRVFSEKIIGFRTGFIMPFASGADLVPMLAAHFDARLEGETYFLEFGAGAMIPAVGGDSDNDEAYGGLFARLGGAKYLGDGDIAPYVGGGIEPRLQFSDGSAVGFAPFSQIGLMFMRESSSRFFVDLQVAQNLLPIQVDENDDLFEEDLSDELYPTEVSLMAGIGW